jgi:ribonuclease III
LLFRFFKLINTGKKYQKSAKWDSLYQLIDYRFIESSLIEQAFCHRSVMGEVNNIQQSYERLEFLGDSILGFLVTEALYKLYPSSDEGELTRIKSSLVSRHTLGYRARKLGFGKYLLLSRGEESSGGRSRHSILADVFEAVIGAMYLDGGLDAAKRFIEKQLFDNIEEILNHRFHGNFKSRLLEFAQARGWALPHYKVIAEDGPDHSKWFTIQVILQGKAFGEGKAKNKKTAEQIAAEKALEKLEPAG